MSAGSHRRAAPLPEVSMVSAAPPTSHSRPAATCSSATAMPMRGCWSTRVTARKCGSGVQLAEAQDNFVSCTRERSMVPAWSRSSTDRHGHLVGNRALSRLSAVLQSCGRNIDTAARFGGDEFSMLLLDTDGTAARQVARRVSERLAADQEEPPLAVGHWNQRLSERWRDD